MMTTIIGTRCLGSVELVFVFYKNAVGWKDVVKVEYNDPHKFASKLSGFLFTVQTNTVGHLWESKI